VNYFIKLLSFNSTKINENFPYKCMIGLFLKLIPFSIIKMSGNCPRNILRNALCSAVSDWEKNIQYMTALVSGNSSLCSTSTEVACNQHAKNRETDLLSAIETYIASQNYATQTWVTNLLQSSLTSQNYVTSSQLTTALAPYVTQTYLTSQNYVTSSQLTTELATYATQAWVTSQLNTSGQSSSNTLDTTIKMATDNVSIGEDLQAYVQSLGGFISWNFTFPSLTTLIQVGNGSLGDNSLAIGTGYSSTQSTVTFKSATVPTGSPSYAMAIGAASNSINGANAGSMYDIAIGTGSSTAPGNNPGNSIAIGAANGTTVGATTNGNGAIAIGSASGNYNGAQATGSFCIAIGSGAQANSENVETSENIIALGVSANANAANAMALGFSSIASAANSIAIGCSSQATTGTNNIALGTSALASGNFTMALGNQATAQSDDSIAIGFNATVSSGITNSCAIGYNAMVSTANTIQFGNEFLVALSSSAVPVNQMQLSYGGSYLTVNGSACGGTISIQVSVAASSVITTLDSFSLPSAIPFGESGYTAAITLSPASSGSAGIPIYATFSEAGGVGTVTVSVGGLSQATNINATWYYHIDYYPSDLK
jgi:hypothetical protein